MKLKIYRNGSSESLPTVEIDPDVEMITLGRSPRNRVQLNDRSVAYVHAAIETGHAVYLIVFGFVKVNDEDIQPNLGDYRVEIKAGDTIKIGPFCLQVIASKSVEPPTAPKADSESGDEKENGAECAKEQAWKARAWDCLIEFIDEPDADFHVGTVIWTLRKVINNLVSVPGDQRSCLMGDVGTTYRGQSGKEST